MKIIGLCGRRQSGKNTFLNSLVGEQLKFIGQIDGYTLNKSGQLVVPALLDDGTISEGVLDPFSTNPDVQSFLAQTVFPVIKPFSFADTLKQMCISVFGCSYEQCFGTNDDKNTLTEWTWRTFLEFLDGDFLDKIIGEGKLDSLMSARQILQCLGTDVFRNHIDREIWVKATIRNIKNGQSDLYVGVDCRFVEEAEAIRQSGGKLIKLTRQPLASENDHSSEKALDDYPDGNYDYLCDNAKMSIDEQNEDLKGVLKWWGWWLWG